MNWDKYYDTYAFPRARIRLIELLIAQSDDDREKKYLQQGRIPDSLTNGQDQEKYIKEKLNNIDIFKDPEKYRPKEKLSFEEITTLNTWFFLHPEKVAGQEVETGSRYFPLQIKGTKYNIDKIVDFRILKQKLRANAIMFKLHKRNKIENFKEIKTYVDMKKKNVNNFALLLMIGRFIIFL